MGSISETTARDAGEPTAPISRLLLVSGEGMLQTYEVDRRELTIGRGDGCEVRIDHKALSRKHAVLRPGPPATVEDLGSTNGTRIGGTVRRGGRAVELALGESFQIGPFSFLLVSAGRSGMRTMSGRDVLRVVDPTPDGVPRIVAEVAATRANVLILGETGCGKEVLAETVHLRSGRVGPLARINCAALTESLLESELFGYEKGAFTGAAGVKVGLLEGADGGTVFLDEVGEMPLTTQAKLLRAVERREVLRVGAIRPTTIDVRFVAATNRDLPAEVDVGRFRRDLFYRLEEVTLIVPPLRERRGMIGRLALQFLEEIGREAGRPAKLSTDALHALETHPWPGNVRELRSVIARGALLARGGEIGVRHLGLGRNSEPTPAPVLTAPAPAPVASPVAAGETSDRDRVLAALEACAGNQTRAAKMLGIGRTTLLKKLDQYGVTRPRK